MSQTYYFFPDDLRQMVYSLCKASGSPADEAELVSSRLVMADLAGHPSHGVIRTIMYLRMIPAGMIKPGAVPKFTVDNGSTALIDGGMGYGQVGAEFTMTEAIKRAKEFGVAAIGVTNLSHIGRLADYAVSAANADCVGLVWTSCGGSVASVAPFEGKSGRMGTNPMAAAFPSSGEYPVVLDMATSVYAEGKLQVMRAAGKEAPERVIIDKDGHATTNPNDFYDGGALLPLGGKQGYKGYLLNFLVEALGGLVTGGGHIGQKEKPMFTNSSLMIVLDLKRFREIPVFKTELDEVLSYLTGSPIEEGKEVLSPGQVEARNIAERERTGIALADRTVESIQKLLDEHEVEVNLTQLGQTQPRG